MNGSWRTFLAYPREASKVSQGVQVILDTLETVLDKPNMAYPDRLTILGLWLDNAKTEGLLTAEELWNIRSELAPLL